MADPLGVTITYQGKICYPQFQYARSAGLEPDFGWVAMHRADFQDFSIKESLPGVDIISAAPAADPLLAQASLLDSQGLTAAAAALRDQAAALGARPDPKTQSASRGFLSAGSLTFKEVMGPDASDLHVASWDFVLVSERGIEVVVADDTEDNEVCRVELTDIRYLWRSRGEVFGWINIPKIGTPPADKGSTPTTVSDGPPMIPGSMDAGSGKPWTVERVLRVKILPNLPGNPQLVIQDGQKVDHFAKVVGPRVWDGILPKDALQSILDEFQLVLTLNLKSKADDKGNQCPSVSVWQENDGGLRLETGQVFSATKTTDPNIDARIANSRHVVSYKHIPAVVVVRGAPRIQAARLKLEAVGVSRSGKVVPLVQALNEIGLDIDRATKFAMLSKEERAALLGVSDEGLSEFSRWAFKMYRLPGGAESNADKLPILNATSVVDSTGQLLPLRVYSERHTVVRTLDLLNRGTVIGATARIKQYEQDLEDVDKRIKNPLDLTSADLAILIDKRAQLESQLAKLQSFVAAAPGGSSNSLSKGFVALATNAIADRLAGVMQASKTQHLRAVASVPFGLATTGYKPVDLERGIVVFDEVQGHPNKDGVALEEAFLVENARVELEFAYRVKPSQDEDLRGDFRYFYCLVRNADGSLAQRSQVPLGVAQLPVFRPGLQEVVNLDGTTNKPLLDAIARKIAEQQLSGARSTEGYIVEFCRPVPVINTGACLSVQWSYGVEEIPSVTAHMTRFARFSLGGSSLRTRGFGGIGGLDDLDGGTLHGSVIAPRGPRE